VIAFEQDLVASADTHEVVAKFVEALVVAGTEENENGEAQDK
jgi:hypothetical protein